MTLHTASLAKLLPLAATLVLASCSSGESDADPRSGLLTVSVERLTPLDSYAVSRSFAGRVEAKRRSKLGFELGGELVRVLAEEGQSVKKGQILAELDRDRLNAARNEARAALRQAKAQRELSDATLERIRSAREFDGVSELELDQAEQSMTAAASAEQVAAARLSRIELDLEKSRLRSPYAALIVGRLVDEGEILAPGQPLLLIEESGEREVRFGIAADLATSLSVGSKVSLSINDREIDATLKAILNSRNAATRTVDVLFSVASDRLTNGDIARIAITRMVSSGGFRVPVSALTEGKRGLWNVLVAEPEKEKGIYRLSARAVEVLHHADDSAIVNGAIRDGELLVSEGLQRVVNGQRVKANPAAEDSAEVN